MIKTLNISHNSHTFIKLNPGVKISVMRGECEPKKLIVKKQNHEKFVDKNPKILHSKSNISENYNSWVKFIDNSNLNESMSATPDNYTLDPSFKPKKNNITIAKKFAASLRGVR